MWELNVTNTLVKFILFNSESVVTRSSWNTLNTVEFKELTDFKASSKPGDRVMHAAIVPTNNIRAYIILEDVEFLHDGHAEQHKEQAVLPKQQAS